MSFRIAAACISLLLVAATSSFAQTGAAQLEGTVSDNSGAVIPNANVALENTQTGFRAETKTNGSGLYLFAAVQSGEYRLTVTFAGLQKWEGLATLRAGQQAVINAKLQLMQATDQITVASDATPLLPTSNATLATTVERERIEQLPLNGRSVQTLLSITVPGLEGSGSQPGSTACEIPQWSSHRTASRWTTATPGTYKPALPGSTPCRSFAWKPTAQAPSSIARPVPS